MTTNIGGPAIPTIPLIPVKLIDETDDGYELIVHFPPLGGIVLK